MLFLWMGWRTYRNTRVSKEFCYILMTWGTIWQLKMLLLRLWRWWMTLVWDILSSLNTFWISACMTWNMVLKSTFLGLPDLAWSSRFLQPEQNFLNYMVTILWLTLTSHNKCFFCCFGSIMAQFKLIKHKFPN